MNGGMKVNKVAFCMEDGLVAAAVVVLSCATATGRWMECAFGDGLLTSEREG